MELITHTHRPVRHELDTHRPSVFQKSTHTQANLAGKRMTTVDFYYPRAQLLSAVTRCSNLHKRAHYRACTCSSSPSRERKFGTMHAPCTTFPADSSFFFVPPIVITLSLLLCILRKYLLTSPSIPHRAVNTARTEKAFWLGPDSVDHCAFIVTDGSINIMKFNPRPCGASILVFVCTRVLQEFTSIR